MSNYSDVIGAIDTTLKSATGVIDANVFKFQKLTRDYASYITAFKDTTNSVIHGYIITRASFNEEREASRSNTRITKWIIRGYYSLGDAGSTEATFQGIIDAISTAFSADPTLGGKVLTVENFNLDKFDAGMWGDVLCHFAEMSLNTLEQINY